MFQITTRKLADEEWQALLFYPALVGAVALSAMLPFVDWPASFPWQGRGADRRRRRCWASFGHYLFQLAFQRADASAVTPSLRAARVFFLGARWSAGVAFGAFPPFWNADRHCS